MRETSGGYKPLRNPQVCKALAILGWAAVLFGLTFGLLPFSRHVPAWAVYAYGAVLCVWGCPVALWLALSLEDM